MLFTISPYLYAIECVDTCLRNARTNDGRFFCRGHDFLTVLVREAELQSLPYLFCSRHSSHLYSCHVKP